MPVPALGRARGPGTSAPSTWPGGGPPRAHAAPSLGPGKRPSQPPRAGPGRERGRGSTSAVIRGLGRSLWGEAGFVESGRGGWK